jgi:hypothetical protein
MLACGLRTHHQRALGGAARLNEVVAEELELHGCSPPTLISNVAGLPMRTRLWAAGGSAIRHLSNFLSPT